jgi:hypothetical protein
MKYLSIISLVFVLFACHKDTTPPVISSFALISDKVPPEFNRGEELTLSFEASDNKGLNYYIIELYRNGSLQSDPMIYYFDESNATQALIKEKKISLSPVMDTGSYTLKLSVIDKKDNIAEHTANFLVTGDTIYHPYITFVQNPATNFHFHTGDTIYSSVTTTNNSGNISSVYIFLVKASDHLLNEEVSPSNSIVLYCNLEPQNDPSLNFEACITVGANKDNNDSPNLITSWDLNECYLIAKASNSYGLTDYSLKVHIIVSE